MFLNCLPVREYAPTLVNIQRTPSSFGCIKFFADQSISDNRPEPGISNFTYKKFITHRDLFSSGKSQHFQKSSKTSLRGKPLQEVTYKEIRRI